MKLLLKFNLVFLCVFAAGFGATAVATRARLESDAKEQTLDRARLLMEKASAVRSYTSHQIAPLLQTQMKYTFLPQSVPAFSATEVLATLQKKYPEYIYKEATLNPTNPRDRAIEWEADIINRFRHVDTLKEFSGERETPSGPTIYVARPLRIDDPACLQCHSTIDAAPKPMIERYGTANGFGWNLHEIIGMQVVSVPLSLPLEQAHDAIEYFLGLFTASFAGIGIVLNLMLWLLVLRPLKRLTAAADEIGAGRLDTLETTSKRRDEIGALVAAFGRMRRSTRADP
jgi:protein-histidine pros-kinase